MSKLSPLLSVLFALLAVPAGRAQVVLNEVHYHPVEKARFDAAGNPVFGDTNALADISSDVHEFVELWNTGAGAADVSGWKLDGGIGFTIPAATTIPAGGYLVIAKNPARIQAVYGLAGVLGPFTGQLGNGGDTVRLKDGSGGAVDSVSYTSGFPWAISANALGAGDDFTGLSSASYQYKGRSLQRVSATALANDPANWLAVRPALGATTFADLPTPGAANLVIRAVPKPVVTAISALQSGSVILRSTGTTTVACTFSSSAALSGVTLEYFIDNVNAWNEARTSVAMTALGNNQFTATIPAQPDRSIIRYRIKADRGDGVEVVSPRADDPLLVPVAWSAGAGFTREGWHGAFITPVRSSAKPIYDCFISTDGQPLQDPGTLGAINIYPFAGLNALQTLAFNATGNLRRVLSSGTVTTTYPRELGWPGVNNPGDTNSFRIWNGTLPAVFVENGIVRDIQLRFHGSRYNRRPGRKSYKLLFAEHQLYQGADSLFITDKGDDFQTGHGLHQLAGLPISHVRYVDWYFNADGVQTRLEQGEYNGDLLAKYHATMQRKTPGSALEESGELYKSTGVILGSGNATTPGGSPSGGEGPYSSGNGWPLPATTGAAPTWTEIQRFDYTYALQNHAWVGAKPMRDMINGMWTARGDAWNAVNPNIASTRAWIQANWDVNTELTSLALGNWMCPWDDTTQNHFFWRRLIGRELNGTAIYRWARFLWDFDGMYGASAGAAARDSIYIGEVGDPGNNFRGPHYTKDSLLKAYRAEYKQKLWELNNTLLDPDNLRTLTFINGSGGTTTYYSSINAKAGGTIGGTTYGFAEYRFRKVNELVALGTYRRPTRPANTAPANAAAVLPGAALTGSAFNAAPAAPLPNPPTVPASTSAHASSKWEVRALGGSYDDPVHVLTSTTNKTSLPIPFDRLTFGQTYYWRVTYFDAEGHPSITSAETSFSYGPTSTAAGNISLNEVMADNRRAVANGATGGYPDYVELRNNTAAPIDIGGWSLTDDELEPAKFVFPAGTSVAANGYLVVWCDSNLAAPGLHAGFALDNDGQRVLLIQGTTVRDVVTFGPQASDLSIGRLADGNGAWTLTNPTPGAANSAKSPLASASTLKVNEWMADPSTGEDWLELHNPDANPVALAGLHLSDSSGPPTNTKIPPLSYIAGKGFAKFTADGTTQGFAHCNFKLGAGGDSIVLTGTNGTTMVNSVTFGQQAAGISQGRLLDGAANVAPFPGSASPGASNYVVAPVLISEALTNSSAPFEDAIEVHNPTAGPVDIGGWWLSDDRTQLQKYQIPAGTVLPAGGRKVFYEYQFNPAPGQGTSFSLGSAGDDIALSAVDGNGALTGARALVSFGAAAENVSFGRVGVAGGAEFWPLTARTFGEDAPASTEQFRSGTGAANAPPRIGPIIVNEVMYHPPDLAGSDNARDEFIELHNISTAPVDVGGWKVKGGSDFTFPAGTTILPGDYVLVVSFDPAGDPASLEAFRTAYGSLSPGISIYGPFIPKLSNSSQNLELARPGAPIGVETPYILVDKLAYADASPWPAAADGDGPSLQRISRAVIGNDASNWSGATATAGAVNSGQTPIEDSDGDGMPDTWEIAHGLNHRVAADAAMDADGDGQSNLTEFVAGSDPRNQGDFFAADVVAGTGGGFKVRFLARAGRSYSVLVADNLTSAPWVKLGDIAPESFERIAEIADPSAGAQRFYRVVTPAQP